MFSLPPVISLLVVFICLSKATMKVSPDSLTYDDALILFMEAGPESTLRHLDRKSSLWK